MTLSIRDGYSRNVARALATYLDTHLPRVQSDWWQNLVIYSLSPTQQGFVHERLQAGQPRSCGILDLAGLEKVLRRNQSELRFRANLPDGVVTLARYVADLRHHYSHQSANDDAPSPADSYRAFDMMVQLLEMLGSDPSLIEPLREARDAQLKLLAEARGIAAETQSADEAAESMRRLAQQDADAILHDATKKAEQITSGARKEAVEILEQAHSEATEYREAVRAQDQEEPVEVDPESTERDQELRRSLDALREQVEALNIQLSDAPQPTSDPQEELRTSEIPGRNVGLFRIEQRGEPVATELKSLSGVPVLGTQVPWHVAGPLGLEFTVQLAMVDDLQDDVREIGHVYCESRHGSPDEWEQIVSRLRMGIYCEEDRGAWINLTVANPRPNDRCNAVKLEFDHMVEQTGVDLQKVLHELGDAQVGTRMALLDHAGRVASKPCVVYDIDRMIVPVATFVATRISAMHQHFQS